MRERDRNPAPAPVLLVHLPDGRCQRFSRPFHIGRDPDCDVQIQHAQVSRRHALVSLVRGGWSIRDLQSSNGLLVDGERVEVAAIGRGLTVALGAEGPILRIHPEGAEEGERFEVPSPEPASEDSLILESLADRYFTSEPDERVGGRTMMIRRAFQKIQQKQKRRHRWAIGTVVLVALVAGGYAYYSRQQVNELAREMFYQMKEMEVRVAALERQLAQSGSPEARQMMSSLTRERQRLEATYNRYASRLYGRRLDAKELLILRITRLFGECEVAAPPEYLREVSRYIDMWTSTSRFRQGIERARANGYTNRIVAEFKARNLPAQYFYLALQESDFIPDRSGPRTRFGIAKGMWQFIPETGERYGLRSGRLKDVPRPDPEDERLDWRKATSAAASYIKDIYDKDAARSGLLVMAGYNWGEHRVIDRVRRMPEHPRERNFWKLLEHHGKTLPGETYNYVFSIVSAAVIGENPRLFGFPFDNPLQGADQQQH